MITSSRTSTDQDAAIVADAKASIFSRGRAGGYALVYVATNVRPSIAGNTITWTPQAIDFPPQTALAAIAKRLGIPTSSASVLLGTSYQVIVVAIQPLLGGKPVLVPDGLDAAQLGPRALQTFTVRLVGARVVIQ